MHTLRVTTVNASFLAFCSLSRAVSTPVVEIASPDPRKAPSLIPSAMSISLPQFLRRTPVPALLFTLFPHFDWFLAKIDDPLISFPVLQI